MTVLVLNFSEFSQFLNLLKSPKIPIFVHRNGHISAHDKARIFHESSPKSSDSALSRGSIHIQSEADLVQKIAFFQKE